MPINFSCIIRVTLIALSLATFEVAHAESNIIISIYGLSYHTNIPKEERDKLNEINTGLSVGKKYTNNRISYSIDVGIIKNSYYDPAYWIGSSATYIFNSRIEAGINIRHWHTVHNTYDNSLLKLYGVLAYKLNENIKINSLVRKSGPIVSFSYEF